MEAGGCDSLMLMKATHYKSGGCKMQTADCRLAELRGQFGIFEHRVVRMLITAVSDFFIVHSFDIGINIRSLHA